jgi:uncharacterized protein (UPF0248 family)
MNTPNIIPLVDKLSISELKFPPGEVLCSKEDEQQRIAMLHKATSLGNLAKHKVLITFEDTQGLKRVHTTIWAITDRKILLKAGRTIPIHRIHDVRLS